MDIKQLIYEAREALYTLGLSYEILAMDPPPVSTENTIRDSREAMQRLQIAHENLMRQYEHDNK